MSCSAEMDAPFLPLIAFIHFSVSAYNKTLKSSQLSSLIFSRNVWKLQKVCDNLKCSSFLLLHFWNIKLLFFYYISLKNIFEYFRIRNSYDGFSKQFYLVQNVIFPHCILIIFQMGRHLMSYKCHFVFKIKDIKSSKAQDFNSFDFFF